MPTKFEAPSSRGPVPRAPPPGVVIKPPGKAAKLDGAPLGSVATPPEAVAERIPPLATMRAADAIMASLLLALGLLVLSSAVRMGIGWGSDGPESGFVPFWLAIVLVLCCGWIIVRALRRREAAVRRFATREQLVCVLKVLLPATAMIVATPFLGLYLAGTLYMSAYMRLVGKHSWALSVALPVAMTLAVFFVFERWFLVPLPKGPIEAWLGY
jgi:putative tricarboxylic transport membrane protein